MTATKDLRDSAGASGDARVRTRILANGSAGRGELGALFQMELGRLFRLERAPAGKFPAQTRRRRGAFYRARRAAAARPPASGGAKRSRERRR